MDKIIYVGKHSLTMTVSHHIHNSWELIYCTSGSGKLIFDDRTLEYSVNDIAIIPPFLPHSNQSTEGFTNIHINLVDTPLAYMEPLIIPGDQNGFLLNAFTAAFYYYSGISAERTTLLPAYGQLITTFLMSCQPVSPHTEIVQKIQNNILLNYPDCDYDLNGFLHSLPFSPEYLKKVFRKEIGLTPLQYLTEKRLENAAGILSTYYDKGNISETARLCGFNDPLYFSRLFKKKYGVSPRNYSPETPPLPTSDSDSMKIML